MSYLQKSDSEVFTALSNESTRQRENLEMIASENFVSPTVLEAVGSIFTNKYAEGYPGKRYYGGCEFVDDVERLAIDRAKQLFGVEHVNVQPHSGSQANMAVYFAVLKPGDTVLGMNLSHGGHLTHGSPVNFSGFLFQVQSYGVDPVTERIDFNQVRDFAHKYRPKLIVVGASAYSRQIDFKTFREIADEVGAKILADIAHPAGLVATGLHSNPVPYCEFVTTTTHKTLRGPRGGMIMTREAYAKDVNSKIFPGIQGGPLMHVIAGKAVAFKEALHPSFKVYCERIIENAQVLANYLTKSGFRLVTGGTDNHLMLLDLSDRPITGKEAEDALEKSGITVNKNTVPNEKRSPFVTSGIRIGTPALTTRGMRKPEMELIGEWIVKVLSDVSNASLHEKIKGEVKELCKSFPLFQEQIA